MSTPLSDAYDSAVAVALVAMWGFLLLVGLLKLLFEWGQHK